ncbi:MAG: glycosyltransferase [bacterium]|nr:glycosyltransferase [bacterium]
MGEPWLFLVSLLGVLAAAYFMVWVGGRVRELVSPAGVPLLSLLVVAHNASSWVEGLVREIYRVEEAWGGGRLRFEVAAVDAGSTDETPLILERLRREYASLKVLTAAPGGQPPLEVGMEACHSPLVLVLRAGGEAEPRWVLRTVHALLGRPPARAVEEKRPGR